MNDSVCKTSWCDQGDRPHTRHEATALTVAGEGWTEHRNRAVGVQLVIHGMDDTDAAPMLALVGPDLQQHDVVLDWPVAHQLAMAIVSEWRRFQRLSAPQD